MKHIFRGTSQIERGQDILSLENVTKNFAERPIIADIGFTVTKGEVVVITGPSGSGKSTILRAMAGLERPDNGAVKVMNNDIYKMRPNKRSQLIAKHVGVGFQAHNLDTGFSLLDNIESLAEAKGSVDRDRAVQLAVSLGLGDKMRRKESVATLSGGEKQRVSIARLLLPKPDIVLLDEPTAAIDPHGKAAIYDTLRDLNEQDDTTFIIISHDSVARDYADRELIIDSGRLVSDYPITPTPFTPAA